MNDRVMQFRVGVVVMATGIISALLVTLNSPSPKGWAPGPRHVPRHDRAPSGAGHRSEHARSQKWHADRPRCQRRRFGRSRRGAGEHRRRPPALSSICLPGAHVRPRRCDDRICRRARCHPARRRWRTVPSFRGEVVGNPLDMLANIQGDLKVTINSLGRAGDEVAELADRVDRPFGDKTQPGRVPRLLDKMEVSLDEFSRCDALAQRLLRRSRAAKARSTRPRHDGRLPRGHSRSSQHDRRGVERISRISKASPSRSAATASKSPKRSSIAWTGLGKVIEELTVLTQSVNNREGTIGQLIHNPELYNNLNRLLCNSNHVVLRINELTCGCGRSG